MVHPVNGEVPPVKGRPWKLPHYANRGKTSSSGGELASARSCFSTVRTALGKLRITGLLARFDVARSFPQFPQPLLLQPTIWTSERGADLGSGRCQPRPHLPIYRMTHICYPFVTHKAKGYFFGSRSILITLLFSPKLSDSTHFSENEGRTDASSDGRGFRVSSEGWRVAIFPREREQRP